MQVPRNMQVPHEEVHERVSSILKNRGFCPGEEVICVGNLYLHKPLLSFSYNKYLFKYSFLLLVLEGIVMRMYYLKKSHLTNMVRNHLF